MALSIAKSLRLLKVRSGARPAAYRSAGRRQKSGFKSWASRSYATSGAASFAKSSTSNDFSWLPLASVPLAYAAFWASNEDVRTIEKVNEDIEQLSVELKEPTAQTLQLASKVIARILSLPDSEVRRDTMYLLAAMSTAAKVIAEVNAESPETKKAVESAYAFAEKIRNDPKQTSDELKLDALRCAHKAEYFMHVYLHDVKKMSALLERDLEVIRAFDKKRGISWQSVDESQALWMLAAAIGNLDDVKGTKERLEESLLIFRGVTKETITPDLERIWIERIVSTLSHSYTLELGQHPKTSDEFKRIALALYEQYQRVSTNPESIPKWKDLEIRLKSTVLAAGPQ